MYDENNNNGVVRNEGTNNVVSVGEWLLSYLILCIPIVNIVMMFIWAFGKNTNPSKANYFKASLILAAISIGISIAIIALFGVSLFGILSTY